MKLLITLVSASLLLSQAFAAYDIRDYGAVANDDSLHAEEKNTWAFLQALSAANSTDVEADREVLVPGDLTFNMLNLQAAYIKNVTITIDGTIMASKRNHHYKTSTNGKGKTKVIDFFDFFEVHNFKIQGRGTVDGQGYMWWIRDYIQRNPYGRPCLINVDRGTNLEFTGVKWQNAAFYHLKI